jgi:hypothetical protein
VTDWANILIPLGALCGIALLAYAMIHESRKQRAAKSRLFRDFAGRNGLRYREKDDGTARAFARDFDGLGRFRSSSAGETIPVDVVSGSLNNAETILFRHHIRLGEGWGREWFVAGITTDHALARRCAIQFCKRRSDRSSMYLPDPIIEEQSGGTYDVVVRAAVPADAGKLTDPGVLQRLSRLGADLSFRPEIQVRGNRIAAYPAGRNATIEDVTTLASLAEFTRRVAGIA